MIDETGVYWVKIISQNCTILLFCLLLFFFLVFLFLRRDILDLFYFSLKMPYHLLRIVMYVDEARTAMKKHDITYFDMYDHADHTFGSISSSD